jgi:DUF4097 and DUF4098 domain-containing protein YvlB
MKNHLFPQNFVLGLIGLVATDIPVALGATAKGSFERTLSVAAPVTIELATGAGDISVRTGAVAVVRIKGVVSVNDRRRERAEEILRTIESTPPIEHDGSRVRIGKQIDQELYRNVGISYELVVPMESQLEARTGSGSVKAESLRGPLNLRSGNGSLTMLNIAKKTVADTGSGNITAKDVAGDIDLKSGNGNINVSGIGGTVTARTGSGEIVLANITNKVDVHTGNGAIRGTGLLSDFLGDTSSGNISLAAVNGTVQAKTGNGNVQIDNVRGLVDVRSSSGQLKLANIRNDVKAQTGNGGVTAERISGNAELTSSSGNMKVVECGGTLSVRSGNGSVTVEARPMQKWSLQTSSGNVTLLLPADSAFDLKAHTSSGRVISDYPITIQGAVDRQNLRGQTGQGGKLLEVRTGSGDIQIKKSH